jgi:acyl carrier protein
MSDTVIASRDAVVTLVRDALQEVLAQRGVTAVVVDVDTRLVGSSAVLDSLGLVTLMVDVEQRVDEALGRSITLASERAMSQKHSPFRTVGALADFIGELLAEQDGQERA